MTPPQLFQKVRNTSHMTVHLVILTNSEMSEILKEHVDSQPNFERNHANRKLTKGRNVS